VAQAALDVFSEEPPKFEGNPLIGRPDVICTPHLGASTTEAQEVGGRADRQGLSGASEGKQGTTQLLPVSRNAVSPVLVLAASVAFAFTACKPDTLSNDALLFLCRVLPSRLLRQWWMPSRGS
jgi:hypothetical protein